CFEPLHPFLPIRFDPVRGLRSKRIDWIGPFALAGFDLGSSQSFLNLVQHRRPIQREATACRGIRWHERLRSSICVGCANRARNAGVPVYGSKLITAGAEFCTSDFTVALGLAPTVSSGYKHRAATGILSLMRA